MDLFYQPFIELATFHPINLWDFPLWEIATLGYLFVLYLVSSIHCLVAGYEDKIRTRSYLHFLIFLSFCIFVYILLQPVFDGSSPASAADRCQYPDGTFRGVDEQSGFQCVFHLCSRRAYTFIRI